MDNGSTLLDATDNDLSLGPPGPNLLLELEPTHRVFLSNLADTVLFRPAPHVDIVSLPAPYWPDVFVPMGAPWWAILESVLWHMAVILAVLVLSPLWTPRKSLEARLGRDSYVAYYTPTFPALESAPPLTAPRRPVQKQKQPQAPAERAIRVAHEVKAPTGGMVAAPDIAKLTGRAPLPKLPNSTSVAPAVPLAATPRTRLMLPADVAAVIGPPPEIAQAAALGSSPFRVDVVAPPPDAGTAVKQTTSWGSNGFQTVAVAPAPDVGGASSGRAVSAPRAGVIAPPPSLAGSAGNAGPWRGKVGDMNIGPVQAVGPAPKLTLDEQQMNGGTGQAGMGGASLSIVPPPPSVRGSGAGGRARTGLGSGLAVVPPAPSMQRTGASTSTARGSGNGLLGRPSLAIVPPPPQIQGSGGTMQGSPLQASAMPDSLTQNSMIGNSAGAPGGVVPPPPSIQGAAGGRSSGLGDGSGAAVVPPPPSLEGAGGSMRGSGAGSGMGGSGMGAVAPSPSVDGMGGSGMRGDAASLGDAGSVAPPAAESAGNPAADEASKAPMEEVPMRIVGLAFALPGTSFSSSYEVFIAEKQIKGRPVQLIKLVYWFLPYQRRLSEYHPDSTKMYKLRVKRDQACDESLSHMTASEGGRAYLGAQLADHSLTLTAEELNASLPCYRTTADDYRKAMAGKSRD